MRKRTRSALAALPLVLTLALALTGCGSTEKGSQVASGGSGQQAGDTTSAPASLNPDEMGVKFAQCLREQGLDVADPEPGKGVQLKIKKSSGMDQQAVDKAMKACQQYSPQGKAGTGSDPQAQERIRKFSECMRKNGVEDFPDPKPGQGGLIMTKKNREDPDFAKAQQACQSSLTGSATSGGQ